MHLILSKNIKNLQRKFLSYSLEKIRKICYNTNVEIYQESDVACSYLRQLDRFKLYVSPGPLCITVLSVLTGRQCRERRIMQ